MKRLPPSIRQKTRYLLFEVHCEKDICLGDLVDSVWEESLDYLGAEGSSKADFWVIGNLFDEDLQEGVIRVKRSEENKIRTVLTLIEHIGEENCVIEVKQVSGSLKKIKDS